MSCISRMKNRMTNELVIYLIVPYLKLKNLVMILDSFSIS